ncbi:MAG: ethanolamine ammonia-lyase subunit EutC [Pseudomonadales bacterium]|nr:ethanolamine ammonia-lyase subunit EutC [Pseudomonadales bacterium]
MADQHPSPVVTNPWHHLRRYTDARIGLGRAGISLPTQQLLEFQLAHARARDAVHLPLDIDRLTGDLASLPGLTEPGEPVLLHSQAADRFQYLQRPDLGRRLDEASRERLADRASANGADLALVVVDGLSSSAIQANVAPFLACFLDALGQTEPDWRLAPLTVVQQGRVAIGDDIGQLLSARAVVVLIGERPGLSSPDSVGIYLTWNPKPGLTDASRNCISNVRPAGLSFDQASERLIYLLREAHRLGLSGVGLKDRTGEVVIDSSTNNKNFLTNDGQS